MGTSPSKFAATWEKSDPEAHQQLRAVLEKVREERGCHGAWARFCEDAGEDGLALTEYQLALRDNPDDVAALERLAILYRERGEMEKALSCAERRSTLQPSHEEALRELVSLYLDNAMWEQAEAALERAEAAGAGAAILSSLKALIRSTAKPEIEEEEKVASSIGVPSDADVARFAHLFAGRENVYARQWWSESGEGGYTPVRQPMDFQVVRNHLLGSITIGVYPVRLDNTVTFFAIDLDINKRAIARARGSVQEARRIKDKVSGEARRLQEALAGLGIPALLEDSGYKGRHLWIFLQEPVEAAIVRQFGSLFLAAHPIESADLHSEFFPKQATTGSGIGNLIKLPIGIHRRTGRRSRLLLPDGSADPDPFNTLRSVRKLTRDVLFNVIIVLKGRQPAQPRKEEGEEQPPWEGPAALEVPKPPAPPAAWTAADFETQPEIAHLIRCCAVAAALKEKVEKRRRLSHDEQVVLIHSLGHSNAGVLAVNYLFDACVDVPATAKLQTPLSGNPISCPKIRKRIPHITGHVDCNCDFDFAPDRYPTPRLHLLTLPSSPLPVPASQPPWDPVERTRALGVLRTRRAQLEKEIVELEKSLQAYMEGMGKDRIELDDGMLVLKQEAGGLASLDWEPKAPPEPKTAGK